MIGAAAQTLVSSAACGSDLLALKAAGDLGIRRRVILPFDQATFRDQSVVDRPGDWGPLFDRILSEVGGAGDLTLLGLRPSDRFAYEETNRAILSEGEALAALVDGGGGARVAVVVWDGRAGQRDDHTQQFFEEAMARGWSLCEVFSLEHAP